jgi:hypothetical protein
MCVLLKLNSQWLRQACVIALMMVAGPACVLDTNGVDAGEGNGNQGCENPPCKEDPPVEVPPGDMATSAIMCEIPKPVTEGMNVCATQDEANKGYSLSAAGTALANGQSGTYALDWSQAALAACGGLPKKVEFLGSFPDGYPVCINCGTQIPALFANPTAVCVAKCKELIGSGNGPFPDEGVDAYCTANARTAVNYDKDVCYDGACSEGGTPLMTFVDPRRTPELVKWIDLIDTVTTADTVANANTLTRTAPTTGAGLFDFNAGAASAQVAKFGDGWIEFAAAETGMHHVLGLRNSCADTFSCPDLDAGVYTVGLALNLHLDGQVYVLAADGVNVTPYGPFGPYTPGERYRVRFNDTHDGKASISFSRVLGNCALGTECIEDVLPTPPMSAMYPLRVDVTLQQQGATIKTATLVRIIK